MTTAQTAPHFQEVPHISTPVKRKSTGSALETSIYRDSVLNSFSSFMSQNQVASFVVILLVVVVLIVQVHPTSTCTILKFKCL